MFGTKKLSLITMITLIGTLSLAAALFSCAGGPDAKTRVRSENEIRTYERYKTEHALNKADELNKPGIYHDGKFFYVVISLTDSGTDRYPEWACDKLLTSLYGYKAVNQQFVSDNEFFELALEFTVDEIIEGEYENIARIKVKEKEIEAFVHNYKEEN